MWNTVLFTCILVIISYCMFLFYTTTDKPTNETADSGSKKEQKNAPKKVLKSKNAKKKEAEKPASASKKGILT